VNCFKKHPTEIINVTTMSEAAMDIGAPGDYARLQKIGKQA